LTPLPLPLRSERLACSRARKELSSECGIGRAEAGGGEGKPVRS
jgi:hypothetical protein